nr:PREDICTED: S1 RNA-binding domain-containing protein 1 [Megachile rotundata]
MYRYIQSRATLIKATCLIFKSNFIMKRTVRKTREVKTIIELSDSEDDNHIVVSDDDYVPEKKVSKTNQGKKRIKEDSTNAGNKRKKLKIAKEEQIKIECEDKSTEIKPTHVDDAKESIDLKKKVQSKGTKSKKVAAQPIDKENIKESLKNIHFNSTKCQEWTDVDYVCETNNIDRHIADNVIKLFNDNNTIPFIARYRKNMTGGMEPDKLRALKESLECARLIKQRAATILKNIDKVAGQWSPSIHAAIVSAKSMDDLEHIYSLFKPESKQSLAEKARKLGLGPISDSILHGQPLPYLSSLIVPDKDGLKTEQQIKDGIIHIIADIINKDKLVFDKVKELQNATVIKIKTTKCKSHKSTDDKEGKDTDRKYEMYYDFDTNTTIIKPHQILAINRGEAQKILSVKLTLPDFFERGFHTFCYKLYRQAMAVSQLHTEILNNSIDYAYTKFVKPLVIRRVRNELKQKAETASIEVFVTNVKQLLLTPPVRGKIILGIDPGFHHGCKLAAISEHGNVLETSIIYPHSKRKNSYEEAANSLVNLVNKHKCTILALGNATACRETESFLNTLIKSKAFGSIDVSYTIVDESGTSIYSCSAEAKSEFPNLDVNVVSAISIARRLQDPLAELVKVEPKHLGVGMYQHDLPEKQLLTALNEVVSEAVSFVGVDVNTASQCLLKRVAGLNIARAKNIIQSRIELGAFKNRQQLLDVKGIGKKVFEQCAGFIRILPETSMINTVKPKDSKKSEHTFNLLDQTWIHPESYGVAERFLQYCDCNLENLGTATFIDKIKSRAEEGYALLAEKFDTNETTMEIIVKGLSMKKDEDIRFKSASPLFRKNMLSINDISVDMVLTGAVRNVTHFGAFVDIGVGRAGLIPTKWLNNSSVSVGQHVEVQVVSVELARSRISLKLINIL